MFRRLLHQCSESMQIAILLVIWYATSSSSNTITKVLLNEHQDPTFITLCHFFFVTLFSKLYLYSSTFPSVPLLSIPDSSRIFLTLPISLAGLSGHWLSALSLSYVPISFTHTVKATSPIFSVILSRIFLNEHTTMAVVGSLVPIVLGVTLSTSGNGAEVNLPGFLCAMLSTIVFVFQNVYSKKLGSDLDEHQMLFYTGITCFCCLAPLWLLWRVWAYAVLISPSSSLSAEASSDWASLFSSFFHLLFMYLCSGISYFIQNLTAVMILKRMNPVSYSIGNTLKRVVVIISSILYFGNPISTRNAIGMTLALSGVALYNNARIKLQALRKETLPVSYSNANLSV